jgi:hypothetical protein
LEGEGGGKGRSYLLTTNVLGRNDRSMCGCCSLQAVEVETHSLLRTTHKQIKQGCEDISLFVWSITVTGSYLEVFLQGSHLDVPCSVPRV